MTLTELRENNNMNPDQKNLTQLNITPSGDTVTILYGKALDPVAPEKIVLAGDIMSVHNYIEKRKLSIANPGVDGKTMENRQEIDGNKAIVIVDKTYATITLNVDPEDKYGVEVKGTLFIAPELAPFAINSEQTFNKEQIVKLLKFSRLFFEDFGKHEALMTAFRKIQTSTTGKLNESSDDRGNRNLEYEKSVKSNIPTEFILDIPIYKGQPKQKFRVEICLDVTDGGIRFWLESVELKERMETYRDEIFTTALANCTGLVIINK